MVGSGIAAALFIVVGFVVGVILVGIPVSVYALVRELFSVRGRRASDKGAGRLPGDDG